MTAAMMAPRLPALLHAHGFSWRKRAILRRFAAPAKVVFVRRASAVPARGSLLLWGSRPTPAGTRDTVRIIRVEDGFLRSVGLGADLVQPLSWVFDQCGIYYDATRPSDLENMLEHVEPDADLLARAAALRERIVASGLTKYNVGGGQWLRPAASRHVVLVVGQVESDASLQFGAPGIATNMGMLRAARAAHPNAWLLYKPHPDVVVGLRAQGVNERSAAEWCDEIIVDVPMGRLLAVVDEVHVLTSLAGFEALLRGKRVVCHGLPFYAGWGLTDDCLPAKRRTRRVSLDDLVTVALLMYPSYVARGKRAGAISPEHALTELLTWRAAEGNRTRWWRKGLRHVLSILEKLN